MTTSLFQSFLVLISQHQIEGWTCNQIWNTLNLPIDEKQRTTQQQFYRLLRKLVKQGYLIKNIHVDNPRFSTFIETQSMHSFRKKFGIQLIKKDLEKLERKMSQLTEKQKNYENQIKASEQALAEFPELKPEIIKRKKQLLQDIVKINAYKDFLTSLI